MNETVATAQQSEAAPLDATLPFNERAQFELSFLLGVYEIGRLEGAKEIPDANPLEPGSAEHFAYARGVAREQQKKRDEEKKRDGGCL